MTELPDKIAHEDGLYWVIEAGRPGRFEVHYDGIAIPRRIAVVALGSREESLDACKASIARHKAKQP